VAPREGDAVVVLEDRRRPGRGLKLIEVSLEALEERGADPSATVGGIDDDAAVRRARSRRVGVETRLRAGHHLAFDLGDEMEGAYACGFRPAAMEPRLRSHDHVRVRLGRQSHDRGSIGLASLSNLHCCQVPAPP